MRFTTILSICMLFLCGVAYGQADVARVSGRVSDPNAAVIFGATVAAKNVDTGVENVQPTNDQGIYSFNVLPPGKYEFTVTKQGFKTIARPDVVLHVGDTVSMNFSMQVGTVTEVVTVQGGAPLLNTENASVGTVVERDFIQDMPLNGRSFQSLITITPGVNTVITNSNTQGQFVVNGQRSDTNYFTVDGVSAMVAPSSAGNTASSGGSGAGVAAAATGGYQSLVSVDALQEFKITTSSYAPEFGRFPGGQISLVTRGGTNKIHGDVFDYLRNTILDANDWFLNSVAKPRGVVQQNDFGGVVGGPIIKDKLFFFGSYEGLRLSNPTPSSIAVPTASARAIAATAVNNGVTGYMAQFLNAYPLPTPGQPNTTATCTIVTNCSANFVSNFPGRTHLDAYSIRGDYVMNTNNTIYYRYSDTPSALTTTNAAVTLPVTFTNLVHDAGWTHIFNSNLTNSLIFGYSYVTRVASDVPLDYTGTLSTIFPAGFAQPATGYSLPNMQVQIGTVGSTLVLSQHATNQSDGQLQITDTVSWTVGSHAIKFGGDFRQLHSAFVQPPFNGNFSFAQLSNNSNDCTVGAVTTLPAYICGNASTVNLQHIGAVDFGFNQYSTFIQDTWKISGHVTLTYGLRWEIDPSPQFINNAPTFAITPGSFNLNNMTHIVVAPLGSQLYATTWANLAPRLGLAWQESTDPKWGRVVRAGAGLFYDTGAQSATQSQGPYAVRVNNTTAPNVQAFVPWPLTTANSVFLAPPAFASAAPFNDGSDVLVDPFFRLPRVFQMNLAVEQQLGARQSLTVSYVGALGKSLLGTLSYPAALGNAAQLGNGTTTADSLTVYGNFAASTYHALQAKFQKQVSNGLGVLASYTWAHSIDDGSNNTALGAFLPTAAQATSLVPISLGRGNSDFDVRQTLGLSVVYNAPTPWKENAIAKAILGNWSFDPIYHFQTALPEDITTGISSPFSTSTFPQRPNLIVGPNGQPVVPIYVTGAACAAEYLAIDGYSACPGGQAFNSAAANTANGATTAQITAAGCQAPTATNVKGAFCTPNAVTLGSVTQQVSGNVGRNFLRANRLQELDFSLHRSFPIHESIRLQFQADMFNVFNHPQFGPMGAALNSTGFGLTGNMANTAIFANTGGTGFNPLYQLGGPRNFQFALKLYF